MPPVATPSERKTKKRAEEALTEYSKMSLATDSPIQLSILKPGWVYGNDRFFSSLIGLTLHNLFDKDGKQHPPRNLSAVSVNTLAVAAVCQALNPNLADITKLYNHQLQVYSSPKAMKWLREMSRSMFNKKQASSSSYDFEAF